MRKSFPIEAVFIAGLLVAMVVLSVISQPEEVPEPRSSTNYGWTRVEEVAVTTAAGVEGTISASALTDDYVRGHIYAIHLDFAPLISETTDITITAGAPALTVLQLSDYYTDTWYYPASEYTNSSGTGLSAYGPLLANDRLTVAVGETISSTQVLTATVIYGE